MPVMTLINPANFEIGSQTTWHLSLCRNNTSLPPSSSGIHRHRFVAACRREHCNECAYVSTPI